MAPWRFKGILESEFGEEGSRAPQEVKAPSTSPICLPLTLSPQHRVIGPFPSPHSLQAQSSLSTRWSPLRFFRAVGMSPVLVSLSPIQAPLLAGLLLVRFGAMEFTKVAVLASNLASKILSAGSLAKVGGAASSSILAGLPSLGECSC